MKISKSLLKAIVIGVTVSTAAASCEKIVEDVNDTNDGIKSKVKEKCGTDNNKSPTPTYYDCPACGMG